METRVSYTIIIPHHNVQQLLTRCLRSIPDRKDIQVIVVDDHSDDYGAVDTAIREVGYDNIELHQVTGGKGAGAARNVGLTEARGKWLIFADADDFFVDGFLTILDRFLDASEDIIYFNTKCCLSEDVTQAEEERTKDFMFERYRVCQDENLFRFGYTEPWGKMIRRELAVKNNIKFDETMVSNDYLFSVKTGYFAKSVQIVDERIYVYTVRQGSLTSDDNTVRLDKLCARLDAYINVQSFMQSVGYHSSPALTSHILVPLFKNYNSVFRVYCRKLIDSRLSFLSLLLDTMTHYIFKVIGKNRRYGDVYLIKWKK